MAKMQYSKDEVFDLLSQSQATKQAKDWLLELEAKTPGYPRALLEILTLKYEAVKLTGGEGPKFDLMAGITALVGMAAAEAFKLETDEVIRDLQKLEVLAKDGSQVLRDAGLTQENAEAIHAEARAEREMMDAMQRASGGTYH